MITNDRQYKIAKGQIENFQNSLEELSSEQVDFGEAIHPKIIKAHNDAVRFKLNEMLSDVKEYEDLKAGRVVIAPVNNLRELPVMLIKSRIANGLTQLDLAKALGLKEQQIQRYESEKYETASLKTLLRIADTLNVHLSGDVQIKELEGADLYSSNKYPFKQMFERNWFTPFKGSYNEAVKNSNSLIEWLFDQAQLPKSQLGLNKQSIRSGSVLNEFALKAWYARVVVKAREQVLDVIFDRERITDIWIKDLTKMSANENGPVEAVKYLRGNGIHVVIEPHLEGTHLDGAALLIDDLYPIIALTLRYDRLDNFWFVLLHELAHVVLHLGADYTVIFDDLDVNVEGIELEADNFALNALIPDTIWKHSLVRFSPSEKTIVNQARALNISPALIAGRIRRETGRFYEFTDLVGQGQVRNLFNYQSSN
jgi:HTH-type transcriptional regulator/antitoxin HigA